MDSLDGGISGWRDREAIGPRWRAVARGIILTLFVVGLQPLPSAAQVIRDGSIGSAGPGSVATAMGPEGGTDYLIGEADGQRAGSNLFHSFDQFDLNASERAIYQGSSSIQNLITRVTGGLSSVDGVIRSEIPGANLYFLNPAGVLFGENAQVDITGSFYTSTADQLLFENGDVFETSLGSTASLSLDAVDGFGFLDAPAPIRILGSQIEVAVDQSIGLIGGDLEIRGDRSDGVVGFVRARSGRIDLASVQSSGQVYLEEVDSGDGLIRFEDVTRRGDVTIAGNTSLSTSGIEENPFGGRPAEGSGPVNIKAANLLIEDADITTLTVTNEDGGDVAIDLDETLVIRSVPGGRQSGIIAGTGLSILPGPDDVGAMPPNPGVVVVPRPTTTVTVTLCVDGPCGIRYDADGRAGDVLVQAANVQLENGGRVTARSDTRGDAGTIRLEVSDSILLSGIEENGERSGLSSTAESTGNPGAIEIISPEATLVMEDQAAIVIQNSSASLSNSTPGRIEIDVARVAMSGDSRIDSSTRGAGPGGNLEIRARDSVELAGRTSAEEFTGMTTLSQPDSTGAAGSIRIETAVLELEDGAEIAARPVGSEAFGDAGNLALDISDRISLQDSTISTASSTSAGGSIDAYFGKTLRLENSEITSSVIEGPESGGNVALLSNSGSSMVLENSNVIAEANGGPGGNILIETSLLLLDPNSRISASSNLGIDGTVVIRAPDAQLIDTDVAVDALVLDATALLDEPCAARRPGASNSLVVAQPDGLPLNVEAVLPSLLPNDVYARLGEPGAKRQAALGERADSLALASLTGSERFVSRRSVRCID